MPRSHRLASIHVRPSIRRTTLMPSRTLELRNNHRIYAEDIERLEPRSPSGQFSMFDVVRHVMVAILPAMLDALVVKHLGIMIEVDT